MFLEVLWEMLDSLKALTIGKLLLIAKLRISLKLGSVLHGSLILTPPFVIILLALPIMVFFFVYHRTWSTQAQF
jgi:hypothetical protein